MLGLLALNNFGQTKPYITVRLLLFKILILFSLIGYAQKPIVMNDPNRICGKWETTQKSLIVQVYREGETYKAKLLWFDNVDKTKAMDEWTDQHNPDPALRNRKLLGMSILRDMKYAPKSNTWENGKIYDAKTGREWSTSIQMNADGQLKITAYWHFKFIGKTMTLVRV